MVICRVEVCHDLVGLPPPVGAYEVIVIRMESISIPDGEEAEE